MEKKIPSAEEFLKQKPWIHGMSREDLSIAMIAFAKLHVEACKEEIAKNAEVSRDGRSEGKVYYVEKYDSSNKEQEFRVDTNSILNSYPLENIK